MANFSNLSAVYINCSLKPSAGGSHTQRLMDRSIHIMREHGVAVETIHALDYSIAFGMAKEVQREGVTDDWPALQAKVMGADICVVGTPIWLGVKSSVASLVIERMYAYSGETNQKGQYAYYGKVGGAIVTGNEDGVKACSKDILYCLQHIGYTIPPQADCGWIGEIGPGKSYGDTPDEGETPVGFDNDFTNKNTTIMTYNLLHMAKLLKENDGLPAKGTTADNWRNSTNATDAEPESL